MEYIQWKLDNEKVINISRRRCFHRQGKCWFVKFLNFPLDLRMKIFYGKVSSNLGTNFQQRSKPHEIFITFIPLSILFVGTECGRKEARIRECKRGSNLKLSFSL